MAPAFSEHSDPKEELALLYAVMKSDRTPEEKKRVQADMRACAEKYQFTFKEYVRYRFDQLTPAQQHAFVSDREHMLYCERLNSVEANDLLDDKYRAYLRFRPYYRREAVLVTPDHREDFPAFAEACPGMIVKPNDDWGGKSVFAADAADYPDAAAMCEALLEKLPTGFIAEERLTNAGVLYDVHPASLNTLRVSTVKLRSGEIRVIHPRVRFGVGGSVMDNISAGGFQGQIDPETGVVIRAVDSMGVAVTVHPDTGVAIQGMQIPDWQGARTLVTALAGELETLHYCGWDIAFTPRGWVMIEGNAYGQFGWQFVEQQGCRAEFEGYIKDLWRQR